MILTITLNPSIDIGTHCRQVQPGRKVRCRRPQLDPGGGGINVCRVINELQLESSTIWLAGGYSGRTLQELLTERKISGWCIDSGCDVRQNLYVAEDSSEQEYRFVMPGPELSEKHLQAVADKIDEIDDIEMIVFSGSLPRGLPADSYKRLAQHAGDVPVVVDTSSEALQSVAEYGAFLVKPNRRELSELVGSEHLKGQQEMIDAACEVLKPGRIEWILLSLGPGGALLIGSDQRWRIHAPSVKVRSTVGAGDSMVAGTACGFSRGYPPDQAARLGVAAGSAAVLTDGTQLCRRDDVDRLWEETAASEIETDKG
ncbi:MAG: 1-phosphofructokinase family hexose kinase [Phycisphaerae bacterium]